jgi:TonB family protein
MIEAPPILEIPQEVSPPRLLVELPSRRQVFFQNLHDVAFPRRLPPLELHSAPAPFWPDVFVRRGVPWSGFVKSGGFHLAAFSLLVALTEFFALQPRVRPKPAFDRAQVITYQASPDLPPLDTRSEASPKPEKADPEYSRQPIISVPREADNREQTIVAAPNVRLKRNVAMPNIVAWSDVQKPRLAIPDAPLTPAAELTRLALRMENSVVAPPPDATQLTRRMNQPSLQAAIVAPPPELRTSRRAAALDAPEPSIVAPPPTIDNSPTRRLGEMNIGRSNVIAPAPQLPVAEQRAVAGGRSSAVSRMAPQVVPPPPSTAASGAGQGTGASFGSRGRVVALSLHPAVGAPPSDPAGNRRGSFAATPEGHNGASGSPGASASGGTGSGSASVAKGKSSLPAGLYVGSPSTSKTSSVAGNLSANAPSSGSPNVPAPRASVPTHSATSGSAAKLADAERAVFGDRRFYSVALNMPNLNSAGGSWIIHFAEMNPQKDAPAADLSQPVATKKVDPGYPLQLIHENVAGTVILYAVIAADGTVGNVKVLRGVDTRLDRFASDAVTQWRFQPALKNGSPVAVEATFVIPFKPPKTEF